MDDNYDPYVKDRGSTFRKIFALSIIIIIIVLIFSLTDNRINFEQYYNDETDEDINSNQELNQDENTNDDNENSDPGNPQPFVYRNMPYCIHHWRFDEGHGYLTADSMGGYIGSLNNLKWTNKSKSGYALEFTENNSKVSVPSNFDDQMSNNFTIEAWIYWYGSELYNSYIIDARGVGTDGGFIFYIQKTGHLRFFTQLPVTQGGYLQDIISESTIPTDEWTHVAAVFDTNYNRLSLFINGVEDKRVETNLIAYTDADDLNQAAIGNNHWSEYAPFNGIIDELIIHNWSLSNIDIESAYILTR